MENMIRLERAIQIKNLNRTGEIRILFDPSRQESGLSDNDTNIVQLFQYAGLMTKLF